MDVSAYADLIVVGFWSTIVLILIGVLVFGDPSGRAEAEMENQTLRRELARKNAQIGRLERERKGRGKCSTG